MLLLFSFMVTKNNELKSKLYFFIFVQYKTHLKLNAMKSILYIFLFCICFSFSLSSQNYTTLILEDWKTGAWVNTMRMANTFDSNGRILKFTGDEWNSGTSVWDKNSVSTNTLNANGTINYTIMQSWDVDLKVWEDAMKTIYTYDASKNVLTSKSQIKPETDWMDFSMTTNTYNSTGQLTKSVDQQVNILTMQMVNSYQDTYTYNADGTENQNVSQQWNATTNAWENTTRYTNTYDGSKRLTVMLMEKYGNNAWVNDMKSTFTYNADGTVKESLEQKWNVALNKWEDAWKDFYTYNTNATPKQILNMEWSSTGNNWVNQSRMTYSYGATIIEPNLTAETPLQVFPNPFSDVISIKYISLEGAAIRLFNINGQLVRTFENGEPLSDINLSGLRNGIYFLQVNSAESRQVLKLVKH